MTRKLEPDLEYNPFLDPGLAPALGYGLFAFVFGLTGIVMPLSGMAVPLMVIVAIPFLFISWRCIRVVRAVLRQRADHRKWNESREFRAKLVAVAQARRLAKAGYITKQEQEDAAAVEDYQAYYGR